MTRADVDVLVVGGGPAGLSAAVELRRAGVKSVAVLEREAELGGIPRHCHHLGFGVLDLHRVLSGPGYARRRAELALAAGVQRQLETTALAWTGPTTLRTSSPAGLAEISARAVLLATGCRERPRAARLVPGDRPAGVLTTGSLQQLVYFNKVRVGTRAVIVGAEHVSFSAVETLAHGGARVAAMVTSLPRHQSYEALRWLTAGRRGAPILTGAAVTRILGRARVEAVEVGFKSGEKRLIPCDTVVFTGDWIPDHELARLGNVPTNPLTRGPRIDTGLRTLTAGVFAAGNLLRGAEVADVAALEGRAAAASIANFLKDGTGFSDRLEIGVKAPLDWICPNLLVPGEAPPRGHFILRVREFRDRARLQVRQAGRLLDERRVRGLVPNRPIHLPSDWIGRVSAADGPIAVSLAEV